MKLCDLVNEAMPFMKQRPGDVTDEHPDEPKKADEHFVRRRRSMYRKIRRLPDDVLRPKSKESALRMIRAATTNDSLQDVIDRFKRHGLPVE